MTFIEYLRQQLDELTKLSEDEVHQYSTAQRAICAEINRQLIDGIKLRNWLPEHTESLKELLIDSVCGRECVSVIDRAAMFLMTLDPGPEETRYVTLAALSHMGVVYFG
jgi:hypothetical protein